MSRIYGPKYDENLSTTEIAKRFRSDVKAALAAGELPKGLKLSVRTDYFSMGSSIDVRIKEVPGLRVRNPERETNQDAPWATPEAWALKERLQGMLDAYNHDGSQPEVDHYDVNFYGHIQFALGIDREAA